MVSATRQRVHPQPYSKGRRRLLADSQGNDAKKERPVSHWALSSSTKPSYFAGCANER
jgi:hypothetical protein